MLTMMHCKQKQCNRLLRVSEILERDSLVENSDERLTSEASQFCLSRFKASTRSHAVCIKRFRPHVKA